MEDDHPIAWKTLSITSSVCVFMGNNYLNALTSYRDAGDSGKISSENSRSDENRDCPE